MRETQFNRNDKEEEKVADTQPVPSSRFWITFWHLLTYSQLLAGIETEEKERGDKIGLMKPQRKRRIEFTDMLPFEETSIPHPKTSPQKRRKLDSDSPKAEEVSNLSNAKKIDHKEKASPKLRAAPEKGKEKGDKEAPMKGLMEENQSPFSDHNCANCVEVTWDSFLFILLLICVL